MFESIKSFLHDNIGTPYADNIITVVILAGIAVAACISFVIARLLARQVTKLVHRSSTHWDDEILNPRMLGAISQLVPALIVNWLLPGFFGNDNGSFQWIRILTSLYILGTYIYIVIVLCDNIFSALKKSDNPAHRKWAVPSFFDTVKVVSIILGVLVCISLLLGRSIVTVLTALGATAGVMMLVFKDTILGFVASVQLTANKMLKEKDWIVAEKYGVNGEVLSINLTTVKVLNWDHSVSTIPPYALVSDSFRNYNEMRSLGARRVARSIYIDMNTVRFCTPDELQRLRKLGFLDGIDGPDSGRTVNLGLLRRYLEHYLATHPQVRYRPGEKWIMMVRQLDPTPSGLPLQLYFFVEITEWKAFEQLQCEIFDHVYAVVGAFGLRIFQTPAGADITALKP